MRRFLTQSPTRLCTILSLLAIATVPTVIVATVMVPSATAATRSVKSITGLRNKPICYVELSGKSMVSLDQLCGVGKDKSNTIDLSVDADKDGVPDQLLAEMRKFRKVIDGAKSSEEYQAAYQRLEDRMPYSSNVKRLQAQQRQLQKQLENGKFDENSYSKLSVLQEKIYKDPSYTKVQAAMSKVYRKINQ
jgi:hypothetical protein